MDGSQYHQLRFVADQGVLLLDQLEPFLHELGVVFLAHSWESQGREEV